MGAIVDTLHLGQAELSMVKRRYPDCVITNIDKTTSHRIIQRYRVIIPGESEESYYLFLLNNCMAMTSTNFLGRLESDQKFAQRMRAKVTEIIEKNRVAEASSTR